MSLWHTPGFLQLVVKSAAPRSFRRSTTRTVVSDGHIRWIVSAANRTRNSTASHSHQTSGIAFDLFQMRQQIIFAGDKERSLSKGTSHNGE
jgi:hypothetical protein